MPDTLPASSSAPSRFDPALLRRCVAGIDDVDPLLAARVAAYLHDGSEAAVLGDLSRTQGLAGRLNRYGHESDAAAAGRAARDELYAAVTPDAADAALLVRLGRVLEAADDGKSLGYLVMSAPGWLVFLVRDAFDVAITGNWNGRQQTFGARRAAWNVRLLRALFEDDGRRGDRALLTIFDHPEGMLRTTTEALFPHLLAPGALDEDMLAHPEAVDAAARDLSPVGRVILANRIGASDAVRGPLAGVLARLATGDSKVAREAAAAGLERLDGAARLPHLAVLMNDGPASGRVHAVELAARIDDPGVRPALEAALENNRQASVQQAIRTALARMDSGGRGAADWPEPPPLVPLPEPQLGPDAVDLLLQNLAVKVEEFKNSACNEYLRFDAAQLRDAMQALNGDTAKAGILNDYYLGTVLELDGKLASRPDFGPLQAMMFDSGDRYARHNPWNGDHLREWVLRQDPARVDLRQLSDVGMRCGHPPDAFARACVAGAWNPDDLPQGTLPPERVWPCLAMHPEVIDKALDAVAHGDGIGSTLSAIDTFPAVPARWHARLLDIALGETKTNRQEAQDVLGRVPGIALQAAEALQSAKIERRIHAARWLGRLGDRAAVPALYAALDKETRETASAALMTALERLGEDLAPRLAPDVLLKEARKGLKGKAPPGLAWLNLDALPACAWEDGSPVEPEIVRWWVILAARLKEPAANALLERYVNLLAPASRIELGRFLLRAFVAHDTERQGDAYVASALGEKGILALVFAVPGHELADTIRSYMREHYLRRAQIEALLETASVSRDPAAIQFVLGIARRYRTASVKEKARLLVDAIAERNGWTPEQLGDRTVPTGGLDETGRMTFQYGAREFTVVLDEKFKPVLHNAEGKAVAALPEPRKDDDEDAIKEGKALFTACRKEVKQAIDQQTARLYEAMCAGRAWGADEWDEYVRRHPVVGRLAQRLAWTRLGADGAILGVFRPVEDGSLVGADDGDVAIAPGERIGLAHAALLDDATARAWTAHFKDYKIAPLFAQFRQRAPVPADSQATEIDDRLGWMTETFALRTAFTKLGYQRAASEESGFFDEYLKDFASAGLRVRMVFTGGVLPEDNRPAALKTLAFARLGPRRGSGRTGGVLLADVPPALLAEAYGDYLAVAAGCQGFDPDWKRKTAW